MNFGTESPTVVTFHAEALIPRHVAGLVQKISTAIKGRHVKLLMQITSVITLRQMKWLQ
jgi:hypothetical protein